MALLAIQKEYNIIASIVRFFLDGLGSTWAGQIDYPNSNLNVAALSEFIRVNILDNRPVKAYNIVVLRDLLLQVSCYTKTAGYRVARITDEAVALLKPDGGKAYKSIPVKDFSTVGYPIVGYLKVWGEPQIRANMPRDGQFFWSVITWELSFNEYRMERDDV